MILTKAYIKELPKQGENTFKVRVPLMEDNTGTEAIFDALLCTSPSTFNGYNVGDCVYVHFENERYNECVILGKLFTKVPTTSSAYVLANELKVTDHAYLPPSTRLGDYTAQDLTNLYNSVNNGGSGSIDDEDLKEYVKWVNTRRKKDDNTYVDIYANKIQVMNGSEFDELAKKDTNGNSSLVSNTLYFLTSKPSTEWEPESQT